MRAHHRRRRTRIMHTCIHPVRIIIIIIIIVRGNGHVFKPVFPGTRHNNALAKRSLPHTYNTVIKPCVRAKVPDLLFCFCFHSFVLSPRGGGDDPLHRSSYSTGGYGEECIRYNARTWNIII